MWFFNLNAYTHASKCVIDRQDIDSNMVVVSRGIVLKFRI